MKYKVGIVGCGRIASEFDDDPKRTAISSHAGAYFRVPQTELTAIADLDEVKLDRCGKRWNVKSLYLDYREMLAAEDLDILSICTWNKTHFEITEKAVENGVKAIFCEKPIADTLDDAHKMVEICNRKGILLQINHQRRFCTFHQDVRAFLVEGGIGRVQQVSFFYTAGIANTGSHMFDLLRFFFGEVSWVIAFQSLIKSPNDKDPNLDGLIGFRNNILCSVQACNVDDFLIFENDIIGSKGRLRITHSGFDLDYYRVGDSDHFLGYQELYKSDPSIDTSVPREFMVNGVKHIVDCIESDKASLSSGEDGLRALELICAFHESAKKDGKKVYLPLKESNIRIDSR